MNSSVPQYPVPGTVVPNAAPRTPGIALTRASSASLNAFRFSGVSYFLPGRLYCKVSVLSTTHPTLAARNCIKLLSSSPAATSSTTVIPISAVSSDFLSAVRETLLEPVRTEVCRAFSIDLPVVESAGSKPAISAAVNMSAQANAITAPSM